MYVRLCESATLPPATALPKVTTVSESATEHEYVRVCKSATEHEYARVCESATVHEYARECDCYNAWVYSCAGIYCSIRFCYNPWVCYVMWVCFRMWVCHYAGFCYSESFSACESPAIARWAKRLSENELRPFTASSVCQKSLLLWTTESTEALIFWSADVSYTWHTENPAR